MLKLALNSVWWTIKAVLDNKMVILKVKNGGRAIAQGHHEPLHQAKNCNELHPRFCRKTANSLERCIAPHLEFVWRVSDRANTKCE